MPSRPAGRRCLALAFGFALFTICSAQVAHGAWPDPQIAQESDSSASDDKNVATEPAKKVLDLSSPRATMQTFLVAVQASAGDHPEQIDDAVACLDTSAVSGDDAAERARGLARRLYAVIDQKGVRLEDIPDAPESDTFAFLPAGADVDDTTPLVIDINKNAAGDKWLFTPQTLASIPAIEASLAKAPQEKKSTAAAGVPVSRRSARATIDTFTKAMTADPPDLDVAVLCLDPAGRDAAAWAVSARDIATTLKTVMDKTKVAVLTEIPDNTEGPPYVWHTSKTGSIAIARLVVDEADEKKNPFALKTGEWRFTPQTLKTIKAQYEELESTEIVAVLRDEGITERFTIAQRLRRSAPPSMRETFWLLEYWQWASLAALAAIAWAIQLLSAVMAAIVLGVWLRRRNLDVDRAARRHVVRSLGAAVAALFAFYAIRHLGLPDPPLGFLLRGVQLMLGVTVVWVIYRSVDILGGHIAADKNVQLTRFDDVLIPMLRKILRVLVALVGLAFVTDWMGWEITTILGALGIGGLALAFAAQDTISNFFGSITVLFDRPFGIGDSIVVGDVEGTVERVGFRSTRVRTFYNSVITIPNSKMVNTQVDNYGAREFRRVRVMLSLTYSTPPEKIDAFCEGVRELIRLHPFTRKDYYHVYFNGFAASSLDVLLYAFFKVPDWGTELRERHRLFVDILSLADRLGVEFAFPTQTVWLERSARQTTSGVDSAGTSGATDPDQVGLDHASKLFEDAYGPHPRRPDPVVIDTKPRSRKS